MKKVTQLLLFCTLLIAGVLLDLAPISVPDGIDKIYHLVGFSLITIVAISTYIAFFNKKWINAFLLFLLVFGGAFSGISEFLQTYASMRECSVYDWMANLCGIAIVVVFTFLINSKETKNVEFNEDRFDFKDLNVAL